MPHSKLQIHVRKDSIKFAAAHMTVFPDGTKEALHGHNYVPQLKVELLTGDFENLIPFSIFKSAMKKISSSWDEKVLLAAKNPFFKILSQKNGELEFTLCGKRYVLPQDEVELFALENITAEDLAMEFCDRLVKDLDPTLLSQHVKSMEIIVEETPGQGASVTWVSKK